jgi:putative PIN family toxin of toxin-antitoxin system
VILDTNVVLSGLVSEAGASGRVLSAAEDRRVIPLVSNPVLDEYRAVLLHPDIAARYPNLNARRVEMALHRLSYLGDYLRSLRVQFDLPRDPRDAKFIELAIAGGASHIISFDGDLLSLPTTRTDAGKRFRQRLPHVQVLEPGQFIQVCGPEIGIEP